MTHPIKRHEHLVQEQERIEKELQELEEDKAYQEAIDFQKAIQEVLEMYDKSEDELLELFGGTPAQKTSKSPKKAKKPMPLKHYHNPYTEEQVEARSLSNGKLQEWIKEYGRETVKGWEFDPTIEKTPAQARDDATEPPTSDEKSRRGRQGAFMSSGRNGHRV